MSRERGSVLALVPAGFLVLMILAALAVDNATAYAARQHLHDALSAAANDAVAAAVDDRSFYDQGTVKLDAAAVAPVVCRSVEAQDVGSLHGLRLAVALSGRSVKVWGSARVDAVFGTNIPGFGVRPVRSTAEATLSGGGPADTSAFGSPAPIACP